MSVLDGETRTLLTWGIGLSAAAIALTLLVHVAQGDRAHLRAEREAEAAVRKSLLVSGNETVMGNIEAPLHVVVFSDPECPFCEGYFVTLRSLHEEIELQEPGRVAFIIKNYALPNHFPHAVDEAKILECVRINAGREEYLEATSRLLAIDSKESFDRSLLFEAVSDLIPTEVLEPCFTGDEAAALVEEIQREGVVLGATKTPYTFIYHTEGSEIYEIVGSRSRDIMREIIFDMLE